MAIYSGIPLIRTPMDGKGVHISEVSLNQELSLGKEKVYFVERCL